MGRCKIWINVRNASGYLVSCLHRFLLPEYYEYFSMLNTRSISKQDEYPLVSYFDFENITELGNSFSHI
jgi:hypothetical protein